MKTYFAILKGDLKVAEIKKKLSAQGIKLIKHYPKLKVIKLESDKDPRELKLEFLESFEEEKDDFSV